jgi:hypothetical protein
LAISSRADSTAAWVISSATCAEGGRAGSPEAPALGSGVKNGDAGGKAETNRRSFLRFPSAALRSLDRTWASSIDRGRSSSTTVLASFCQRMLDDIGRSSDRRPAGPVFRAGTCRLPQIGTKPGDDEQETPRNTEWKNRKCGSGSCRVSDGWPLLPGTFGALLVSRGVGNPRLVEAGPGRMPKSSRIFGPSDPGMTFRCCISGISTLSRCSSTRNSHPQFPHFSGR